MNERTMHAYVARSEVVIEIEVTLDRLQLRRRQPRREAAHDVLVVVQDRRLRLLLASIHTYGQQ